MNSKSILKYMMKVLEFFHLIFGLIPVVWFATFLIILQTGTIHFGHVPKEGVDSDPLSLGIDQFALFSYILLVCAFYSFFLWIFITFVLVVFFRKTFTLNKVVTILCFSSVAGYFIFIYIFPEVWGWVLD